MLMSYGYRVGDTNMNSVVEAVPVAVVVVVIALLAEEYDTSEEDYFSSVEMVVYFVLLATYVTPSSTYEN